MNSIERFHELGVKKIGEVLGQTTADIDATLGKLSPKVATYVLETVFGQIYQSDTIDTRTRQIVTVTALATMGNAAPQLRRHIQGALRCGVKKDELTEIMIQLIPYVGLVAAVNGLTACNEVFGSAEK